MEAESCFSIRKNGSHSFSISQADDKYIIEAIKIKFDISNPIREIPLKSGKTLYLIESYKKATLLNIINFLDSGVLCKILYTVFIQYIKFYTKRHTLKNLKEKN